MFLAEEWAATKSVAGPKAARQRVTWSPPAAGWLKANADGAKPIDAQAGGGGVVIRDHHGGFVAGAGHFFPLASDAEHVELLACRRAALLGIEVGARKLELETDSLGTVAKLNNAILDRSIYGPLVEEIKALLQGFDEHVIKHVCREGNGAAHRVAKESCANKSCNSWVGVPPEYLVSVLAKDYAVI
jgi:hypothetical protein